MYQPVYRNHHIQAVTSLVAWSETMEKVYIYHVTWYMVQDQRTSCEYLTKTNVIIASHWSVACNSPKESRIPDETMSNEKYGDITEVITNGKIIVQRNIQVHSQVINFHYVDWRSLFLAIVVRGTHLGHLL